MHNIHHSLLREIFICPPLPDCQITTKYRFLNSGKKTNPKREITMRNIYALFSSTGKILYISKALGICVWRGEGSFRRTLHTWMWQLVTLVAVTLTLYFVIIASNVWSLHLCLTEPSLHIYFVCISPTHLSSLLLFNFLWKDISISAVKKSLTGIWFRRFDWRSLLPCFGHSTDAIRCWAK